MDDTQVQALVEQWRKQIDKQMTEMGLRKYCVEQAIKSLTLEGSAPAILMSDAAPLMSDAAPTGSTNVKFAVVALAEEILEFVSAPFAEIFQTNISEP